MKRSFLTYSLTVSKLKRVSITSKCGSKVSQDLYTRRVEKRESKILRKNKKRKPEGTKKKKKPFINFTLTDVEIKPTFNYSSGPFQKSDGRTFVP